MEDRQELRISYVAKLFFLKLTWVTPDRVKMTAFSRIAGIKKILNAKKALITRLPFILKRSAVLSAVISIVMYIIYTVLLITHCDLITFFAALILSDPDPHHKPVYISPNYLPITIFLTFIGAFVFLFLFFAYWYPIWFMDWIPD